MRVKTISFDLLKIIACFLVIVNHTNSEVFHQLSPSLTWGLSVFYFYISKIAVPIFLMISGALLLSKDYSYRKLYGDKFLKTLILLVLLSFYVYVQQGMPLNPIIFIKQMLKDPIIIPYWYLYMLLGIYLLLPFLRKLIVSMNRQDRWGFFALWAFFSGLLPILVRYEVIPKLSDYINVQLYYNFIGYLFVGYWIHHKEFKKENLPKLFFFMVASLLLLGGLGVAGALYEFKTWGALYLQLDNPFYLTSMMASISVFLFVNVYFRYHPIQGKPALWISKLAKYTYGVYLLHPILQMGLNTLRYEVIQIPNALVSVIVFEICLFVISWLASWCLSRSLIFRKLL